MSARRRFVANDENRPLIGRPTSKGMSAINVIAAILLLGAVGTSIAAVVIAANNSNTVNGGDVRTEELALIISVAPTATTARSAKKNHPPKSVLRKHKGALHSRLPHSDVKKHVRGAGGETRRSGKMTLAHRAKAGQFSEKLSAEQRAKLVEMATEMTVSSVHARKTRSLSQKALPDIHPQFVDATLLQVTASSIQEALDECASRPNVVLCRILLEEGTYTENIHVNKLHGGAGYLSGVGNAGLFVEIIGDTRRSTSLTYTHGGLQQRTVPDVAPSNAVAADAFFGQSTAYSLLEFPNDFSVRIVQTDINGTPLPLTFGSADVPQINFADSRAEIQTDQPIRIYLPLSFNATSCGILAAPTVHDAKIVSASGNTITFYPALPGGVPASVRDGSSVTIMPNVVIQGVASEEDGELTKPTVSVVQNILLLDGVTVRASPLATNPNAGPMEAVVRVAHGGQLFAPRLVIDDVANRATVASLLVSNGGAVLSTGAASERYDFDAPPPVQEQIGLIGSNRYSTSRSSLVIYGGLSSLGQMTVEYNSHATIDDFYGIDGPDPINTFYGTDVLVARATVVASEAGCVFTAGESSVLVGRLSCLNARQYGVFAQDTSRVILSNRNQRIRMEPSEFFQGGCFLVADQGSITTGEDPASLFEDNVISVTSQPLQCRLTASCVPASPFALQVGSIWAFHQSRISALNGVDFQGDWLTATDYGEYLTGDNTDIVIGELYDSQTFGELFSGSMRKLVTTCVSAFNLLAECKVSAFPASGGARALVNEAPAKYIGKEYTICDSANGNAHTITLTDTRFNCDPVLDKAVFTGGVGSCLKFVASEDGSCWNVISSNGVVFTSSTITTMVPTGIPTASPTV